ncbi:MAG TPA: YraN family protein [Candidatus Saccharimonadia bacterium]
MTTTATGRAAEQRAADYLVQRGFQILARNWRTRLCELDIVARRGAIVHIIEVKYRASTRWGAAAEYISYDKTRRLQRAALAWCQEHSHVGPVQIDVLTVEGRLDRPNIELLEAAIAG